MVCNTTTTAHTFRFFIDDDGTTFDESTSMFFDTNVNGNTTLEVSTFWAMNLSTGNAAVKTDTNSAFTFSLFGAELT